MKKIIFFFVALLMSGLTFGQITVSGSIGVDATYTSLTNASGAFAAINGTAQTGANILITITADVINETGTNSLNAGAWASLTINPDGTTLRTISGTTVASGAPMINFNGADNITIDGGSGKYLLFQNTNSTPSNTGATIHFFNGTINNVLTNLILTNNGSNSNRGVVLISTGTNNVTVTNCDIKDAVSGTVGAPASGICSFSLNNTLTISNNNIYNWTNFGLNFDEVAHGCSITNNNFYQTANRTTALNPIKLIGGTSGHTINNNNFGGSTSDRSGNPISTTGAFTGILLAVGTASPTSVQGNRFSNLNITSGNPQIFKGISVTAGNVNIGTTNGNFFGGLAAAYDTICVNDDADMISNTGTGIVTIENNSIKNISNYRAGSVRVCGIYASSGTNIIKNNSISALKSNGIATTYVYLPAGIYLIASSSGNNIENNQISDITLTNTGTAAYTCVGIYIGNVSSTGTATTISKNKIYDIKANGLGTGTNSPVIHGIYAVSGSATYSNNMISLGNGVGNQVRITGIQDAGSGTNNWFYNSVIIKGALTGGSNNSWAFNRSGTSTVNIKNNIFGNSRTGGSGAHLAIANTNSSSTGWTAGASDNNVLNATSTGKVGQWLSGGTPSTFASWKTSSLGEKESYSGIAVTYVDENIGDLHLNMGTNQTYLESTGKAITGITSDYDGHLRPGPVGSVNGGAAYPDIGADEFDGVSFPLMTYVSSTVVQNTSDVFLNTTNNNVIRIEVVTTGSIKAIEITQFALSTNGTTSTSDISNAKILYTGTSGIFAATSQFGSPVLTPSGVFNISGNQLLLEGTNYFWLTYDIPANATINNFIDGECNSVSIASIVRNPTIAAPTGSRTIRGSLSGIYNIGSSQAFPFNTITNAINLINNLSISGPVVFNLMDTNYSSNETFPITINQIAGSSAINTLTIKPNTGLTCTISGNSVTSIFKLNGADFITIDGNNGSGTSRNLTISNNLDVPNSAVIWVASQATGAGATFNKIKNCNISGGSNAISPIFGIFAGGTSISAGLDPGDDNDNLTIENNVISKTFYGIYALASASGANNNLTILQNEIGSNTLSDQIGFYGIYVAFGTSGLISKNKIFNISGAVEDPTGIFLGSGFVSAMVSENKINTIQYTSTYGFGAKGIILASDNVSSNITVSNNIIYDILADGDSVGGEYLPMGIWIKTGGGYKLYYNSINMYGTVSDGLFPSFSAALFISSGVANLDIRNNIFSNSINKTSSSNTSYTIYSIPSSFSTINYNNYYFSGSQGILGFLSSNKTTLNDWRTATGMDSSSVSGNPGFTSDSDLLPNISNVNCWNINGKGTQISTVAVDFANNARSITVAGGATDIGAYEFTPAVAPFNATQTGTLATNNTTSYSVGNRKNLDLVWGASGTVPSNIIVQYASGANPNTGAGVGKYSNAYWDITASGGAGYTYSIVLYYDEAILGTISAENKIILAMSNDGGVNWTKYPIAGTGIGQYQIDLTANKITLYGMTSFSRFTLTDVETPLPVSLIAFNARVAGKNVSLDWTTATESNNDYFLVERSKDAVEFEPIGKVKGMGNSNSLQKYSLIDKNPYYGFSYYRLKQVDFDGKFEYSPIRAVMYGAEIQTVFNVYPVPVLQGESFVVKFENKIPDHSIIEITDLFGKTIRKIETRDEGEIIIHADMKPGLYMIRIFENNTIVSSKILVQ